MASSDILFDSSCPRIMGIINCTPDSFRDGGRHFLMHDALGRVELMVRVGVDAIDIGGESTRPGSDTINVEEEIDRVVPVIEEVRRRFDVVISVDTRKASVAKEALDAGANLVNDVSGMRDRELAKLVASRKVPIIIMHMKGDPKTMQVDPRYNDVVAEIGEFFDEKIEQCKKLGIEKFILDPGIGFGKTLEHNLAILNNLRKLKRPGIPLMIGHSSKGFIGTVTGRDVDARLYGTVAASAISIYHGADILRVHDVVANRDAAFIARAILSEKVDLNG